MNVQTLPPGYKTAPWSPPEKITGAMLTEASTKLIDLLRIRTQPIGMRLFEDPAEMDNISGLRKPTEGFKFTMCQMVTQARWYGFTLGITVDNTRGGNCGGVVGLNHPGEGFLSGDHMERRVVRQQGGVGGASGADAEGAARHLQRFGRGAAALRPASIRRTSACSTDRRAR